MQVERNCSNTVQRQTGELCVGIYLLVGNSSPKGGVIPHVVRKDQSRKALGEEPACYQLVGRVKAYQGYDG